MVSGLNFRGNAMRIKRYVVGLAGALLLAGCATAPAPVAPPTVASMLAEANTAIALGKNEQAILLLKSAAAAFPRESAPRLRAAQLQFDCHNYGEAIFYAQEVLDRDPKDMAALSILAAAGLRVSSKALNDLAARNKLSGSVRVEAQDLVKVIRSHINGAIIPPPRPAARPAERKQAAAPAAAPAAAAPSAQASGDTLADWLK